MTRPKPRTKAEKAKRREYTQHIKSDAWKALRARVIVRNGGQCCRCGSRARLEVHHKSYARFGSERLEDLETLCHRCHEGEHGRNW